MQEKQFQGENEAKRLRRITIAITKLEEVKLYGNQYIKEVMKIKHQNKDYENRL